MKLNRSDQRAVLERFSRDFNREMHNLQERPDIIWQQMYNRLQWSDATSNSDGPVAQTIESEYARRRTGSVKRPWFHNLKKTKESESTVRILLGHTDGVNSCCFSPDGSRIASTSGHIGYEYSVRIWDVKTGSTIKALYGHTDYVTSCCFSPNGSKIASASADKTVKIWDTVTGSLLSTLKGHNYSGPCCFLHDGSKIVSISNRKLRIFNPDTGTLLKSIKCNFFWATSWWFSPNGSRIVSASWNRLKIWDADTGALLKTFKCNWWASSCCLSPDGSKVVSTSRIRLWKVVLGGRIDNCKVYLWDTDSGSLIKILEGHADTITSSCFSPNGSQIATSSHDKTVRIWDATTGNVESVLSGHTDGVKSCYFSPDGSKIVSSSLDKTVRVWESTYPHSEIIEGHSDGVRSCCFSPDGRKVASAGGEFEGNDNTLKIWDVDTGILLHTIQGHTKGVTCCCFSPNGYKIASASKDKTVKVWDANTYLLLATLDGHEGKVESCCFLLDGSRIASVSRNKLRIWDACTGSLLDKFKVSPHKPWSSIFSPDGSKLATATLSGTVMVWDTNTGALQSAVSGRYCAFSHDGRKIVSAANMTLGEIVATIWDAESGDELATLEGRPNGECSFAFSLDDRMIFSANLDKKLKLWDAENGQLLESYPSLGNLYTCCASPKSGTVCCGDNGGNIYILDLIGYNLKPMKTANMPSPDRDSLVGIKTNSSRDRASCEPPERLDAEEKKAATRPKANVCQKALKAIRILLKILFAVGSYSLTLITSWLWILALPIIGILVLGIFFELMSRQYKCPSCGQSTAIDIFLRVHECQMCRRKFILK